MIPGGFQENDAYWVILQRSDVFLSTSCSANQNPRNTPYIASTWYRRGRHEIPWCREMWASRRKFHPRGIANGRRSNLRFVRTKLYLQVSQANEVLICSHTWVASMTFKQPPMEPSDFKMSISVESYDEETAENDQIFTLRKRPYFSNSIRYRFQIYVK